MSIPKPVWALLGLFVIITLASSWNESATSDEPGHLSAGYAKIRYGNFNFNREHPPLLNMWAALPQLILPVTMQKGSEAFQSKDSYELGQEFLFQKNVNHLDLMLRVSRFMIALLGALAGLIIFLWARDLFGEKAAYIALLLWIFNPLVLAHSHYITTDMGATALIVFTLYCFRNYLVHPTLRWVLFSGFALGITLLSKFTTVYLIPIILLYAVTKYRDWKIITKHLVIIFCIALVVVIAGYGFPLSNLYDVQTKNAFVQTASSSALVQGILRPVILALPIPSDYWWGFTYVLENAKTRPSFLFGQYKADGWWYYFPLAFLIKEPIALIVFFLVALGFTLFHLKNKELLYLLIPVGVFLAVFMATTINIGIRHILPVYPFIMILCSQLFTVQNKFAKGALYIGLTWFIIVALFAFPHYTAYFNEFVGPSNGYKYLIDSNIDWGQDLKNLQRYIEKNNIADGYIAYWGTEKPSVRNIYWEKIECDTPHHGWFAISVNRLVGFSADDNKCLHWLRQEQPKDKIGYSIFVYNIP